MFRARFLVLSLVLFAGASSGQSAIDVGREIVHKYGYVLYSQRWDDPPVIDVCWENLNDSKPEDRALVQQAVMTSWGNKNYSKVVFQGWGGCEGPPSGIRVSVRDETPQTLKLGRKLDGRPRGLTLNFAMVRWRPISCPRGRNVCVEAIAIHEFGHALGFSHEQNRPDRPDWCKEAPQGADGDFFATAFDGNSIMNYCNKNWTGQGGLSKLDKEALRKVYS
ncbi:M12 family metallopeptidase [Sphingomonas mali]|uniref:M12 family metallopeptidase n=1 Tax=Sphingomonas mali TaxID=40682 RepID=UPI00082CA58E|nr:M12 family metallopeptidase [Sphingomonas mali]